MGLFQDINDEAQKRSLNFIVIGGIAVIFHGVMRDTADLDLLVRAREKAQWFDLLRLLGYKLRNDRDNFAQLDPPMGGAWPVDLMLVKDETFDKMFKEATDEEMYGTRLKIPILEHLLALKVHALRYGHMVRHMKDRMDVEGLVRVNGLDMKSEKMCEIFRKHGTVELYGQISRATEAGRS